MSAIKQIKKAAEVHLASLLPTLPTSYEGKNFTAPTGMYQICQFAIQPPEDPVYGKGYYRERVQFQVFISAPNGAGTGDAIDRAELVRQHFRKGLSLFEGTTVVHVLTTPTVGSASTINNRILIPVLINLTGEVLV